MKRSIVSATPGAKHHRSARRLPPPTAIPTPLMKAWLAYRQLEAIVDEIDEYRPEPARRVELEHQLAAARAALAEPAAGLLGDYREAIRLLIDLTWLFGQWAPAVPVIDLAEYRAHHAAR